MDSKPSKKKTEEAFLLFEAEAAYAESIVRQAIGDITSSIAAAERALKLKPDYPPALLTVGSIEYQRGRPEKGRVSHAKCSRSALEYRRCQAVLSVQH